MDASAFRGATPAELTDAVEQLNALHLSAQAQVFAAISEVSRTGLWADDGASSLAAWVAHRCRLSLGLARAWVRVAEALGSLPALAAAHAEGRVSFEHLRA